MNNNRRKRRQSNIWSSLNNPYFLTIPYNPAFLTTPYNPYFEQSLLQEIRLLGKNQRSQREKKKIIMF